MASVESKCVDYSGNLVKKFLTQPRDSFLLIKQLLKNNGLIIKEIVTPPGGYKKFICLNTNLKKTMTFNIFHSNLKFDLQRPDFLNINLGIKIQSPHKISTLDDELNKTLILGVYAYEKDDTIDKIIFVQCPITDRNYDNNPSLRVRIDLLQEARLFSDAMWTNQAGNEFRAFQPLAFAKIFNLSNMLIKRKVSENETVIINKKKKPGPRPSKSSYTVNKNDENSISVVYVARWGQSNLWKIGTTKNTDRRLKEFNEYIPHYEFKDQPIWTLVLTKEFATQDDAYDIEQEVLNDDELSKFNTNGERFKCGFEIIQKIINKHVLKFSKKKLR